jgi:L-aminopeptidase/D-esterase-like protein
MEQGSGMRRRTFLGGVGAMAAVPLAAAAQQPPRNTPDLVPRTRSGHASLTFDFPGLAIGTADYAEGPTGCTVFSFARQAAVEIDIRGGASGTIGDYTACDAICLAGGSAMGLEAATGVAADLFARRGGSGRVSNIPLVLGAVIYDFGIRPNWIYPDKALGAAAVRAATPGSFPLGRVGAGSSATVGKAWNPKFKGESAGQGGAFGTLGPTRIAVFTVVNALGAIVDRSGKVVRGNRGEDGRRASVAEGIAAKTGDPPHGNTTLTVVVTNQAFERTALRQIGRQVHAAMARALQPFHGRADGDVLYMTSTAQLHNPKVSDYTLAAAAGELAWEAVLSCFEPD